MIKVVLNPYTEPFLEEEQAKNYLSNVANKLYLLAKETSINKLSTKSGENQDSLNAYIILKKNDEQYNLPQLICKFQGRDRELIIWFFSLFSKGQILLQTDLIDYEDVLDQLEVPAPLICYAAKNSGIVVTISSDDFWNCDFFTFNQQHKALNISYKLEEYILIAWYKEWRRNHYDFLTLIQEEFEITFCDGACNSLPPKLFHNILYSNIQKAYQRKFECDNNFIKRITNFPFYEIRIFESDIRVFFIKKDGQIFIGGFYYKNEAMDQTKAIKKAHQRFKNQDLL